MKRKQPFSRSLRDLDCSTRMFVVSLCLDEEDLLALDFGPSGVTGWVSQDTAARTSLHRASALESEVASAITDLLDLRYLEIITEVRMLEGQELALRARARGVCARGEELAGWAWALLTDPRPETEVMARRLMAECYVRGMRALSQQRVHAERAAMPEREDQAP